MQSLFILRNTTKACLEMLHALQALLYDVVHCQIKDSPVFLSLNCLKQIILIQELFAINCFISLRNL